MKLTKIHSLEEVKTHLQNTPQSNFSLNEQMVQKLSAEKHFHISGYCEVCGKPAEFLMDLACASSPQEPNYRERFVCSHCGLNNRQRFMAARVQELAKNKNGLNIYVYEQVTDFYRQLKSCLNTNN